MELNNIVASIVKLTTRPALWVFNGHTGTSVSGFVMNREVQGFIESRLPPDIVFSTKRDDRKQTWSFRSGKIYVDLWRTGTIQVKSGSRDWDEDTHGEATRVSWAAAQTYLACVESNLITRVPCPRLRNPVLSELKHTLLLGRRITHYTTAILEQLLVERTRIQACAGRVARRA